jgi:hypothetical protein
LVIIDVVFPTIANPMRCGFATVIGVGQLTPLSGALFCPVEWHRLAVWNYRVA